MVWLEQKDGNVESREEERRRSERAAFTSSPVQVSAVDHISEDKEKNQRWPEIQRLETNLGLDLDLDLKLDLELDLDHDLTLNLNLDMEMDLKLDLELDLGLDLNPNLNLDLELDLKLDLDLDLEGPSKLKL